MFRVSASVKTSSPLERSYSPSDCTLKKADLFPQEKKNTEASLLFTACMLNCDKVKYFLSGYSLIITHECNPIPRNQICA
jgi:hypothetical protein